MAARWEQQAASAGQRATAAVAQLESGMAMGWQVVGLAGQRAMGQGAQQGQGQAVDRHGLAATEQWAAAEN
jgi:hypothetical protein